MNWKFIKTNWFTFALVLLVLAAVVRNKWSFGTNGTAIPQQQVPKEANPEKYTSAGNQSLLGFSTESPNTGVQQPVVDRAAAIAFVRRFENVSVSERKKFGIPSSVLLACAYLNSTAGKSDAATQNNNYFALPCDAEWEGETATVDGRCLRRYESAWASFRDFSIYLTSREWFGSVKKSAGKDWQKWAKELGDRGISNAPGFGKELEQVIQTHRLYDLDAL